MKELAKRKFGKRAKNAEQLRQDDEIDAAREYLRVLQVIAERGRH